MDAFRQRGVRIVSCFNRYRISRRWGVSIDIYFASTASLGVFGSLHPTHVRMQALGGVYGCLSAHRVIQIALAVAVVIILSINDIALLSLHMFAQDSSSDLTRAFVLHIPASPPHLFALMRAK